MHPTIFTSSLLVSISILSRAAQAAYVLTDDYSGDAFFRSFDFFTDADPTNGHVKYQSMEIANATGLAGFMDGGNATRAIYMGVDTTKEASEGRDSVRVSSKKTYQHALVVADIVHMPGSVCGTWPAFWMVGDDWPNKGEIDIVEGVNDQTSNQMTLHTSSGPRITKSTNTQQQPFTGDIITEDCDVNAPGQSKNAGCAIADNTGLTFGSDFNVNGGGVYATEWTNQAIKIWFFPRGQFPTDIASSSPSPSQNWGPPTSIFTGQFNMDDHFRDLRIIFDTTFCGDWAGNTWNESSCASLAPTCEQYVSQNPSAFTEAYWAVNTLQVFQDDGTGAETGPAAPQIPVPAPPGSNDTETERNGNPAESQSESNFHPQAESKGRFIKNANVAHVDVVDAKIDGAVVPDTRGRWVQNTSGPSGWEPRKAGGGSVLPRRR